MTENYGINDPKEKTPEQELLNFLSDLGGSNNENKVIEYLTLHKGSYYTSKDILEGLETDGLSVDISDIEEILNNLAREGLIQVYSYTLNKNNPKVIEILKKRQELGI